MLSLNDLSLRRARVQCRDLHGHIVLELCSSLLVARSRLATLCILHEQYCFKVNDVALEQI